MRWLLYGDIGERHVVESFQTALRDAGHEVAHIPSLVGASGPLDVDPDRERERRRLIDEALPADVVFVFRVDELTPDLVRHIRGRGASAIGWLCDDPLYYEQTYRHVVESYDITLHTGHDDLLRFYAEKHGVRGYAFPYWTDDAHYPYVYDPDAADVEVGFVGSFGGKARRRWRYDLLASLPFDVRFFGPVPAGMEDDAAMSLGMLSHEAIPRALRRFRVALNLAQSFDEPVSDRWSSPELARFHEYFFPSRLIAYAAAGVPAISLHRPGAPQPLAATAAATSRAGLIATTRELLSSRESLLAASRATREEFETCLTAGSRVRMLEALLAERPERTVAEHASLWRTFGDRPAPPRPGILPVEVAPSRPDVPDVAAIPRAETRSILLVGRGGRIERQIARGARRPGHDVALVELDEEAALAPGAGGAGRGYGPLEIDDEALRRLAHGCDAAVFVDGCAPTASGAEALRRDGVTRICLRLADPAFLVDTVTYLDRFDAVVTTSPTAAARFREKGATGVLVIPASAEPPFSEAHGEGGIVGGRTGEALALRTRLARVTGDGGLAPILPDVAAAGVEALTLIAEGVVPAISLGEEPTLQPDREGLAYRDGAQLIGMVGYYGRRPEELQAFRSAGLGRVVAGRRWVDRWPAFLDAVPASSPKPEPRIVVAGYYGMDNLGDDLILDVVTAQLGGRVQVLGYQTGAVVRRHGRAGGHLLDLDEAEELVGSADLLVIGSGGLVHDREVAAGAPLEGVFDDPKATGIAGVMARTAAVAAARGTPVALLALGAGPVTSDAGRSLVRFLVQRSSEVSVRDRGSLEVLRACGVTREVDLAADPTLLIDAPDTAESRAWLATRGIDGYVTVAMRRWPGAPTELPERVAAALDRVVERRDLGVVFVPFQRHPQGRRDEEANRAVSQRMRHADAAVHLDDVRPEVALGVITRARAGIAMRLHASILGNAFGVPTLGLAYDPKVTGHYAELGRERFARGLDISAEAITTLTLDLIDRRAEHTAALDAAIRPLRERARLGFEKLRPLLRIVAERRPRTREQRDAGLASLRRELSR